MRLQAASSKERPCLPANHFARDDDHFEAMLRECWRVLDRNGIFFCQLASDIGIE